MKRCPLRAACLSLCALFLLSAALLFAPPAVAASAESAADLAAKGVQSAGAL